MNAKPLKFVREVIALTQKVDTNVIALRSQNYLWMVPIASVSLV